jgi:hypothetical protein
MKIAFCLYGIVGGNKKYGREGDIDFRACAENIKEKIFRNHDVDVFIHTWSNHHQDALEEIYEPKAALYEPQQQFEEPPELAKYPEKFRMDWFVEHSRWLSTKKVIELQHEYSKKHNIEYDFIMLHRFDMYWYVPFMFEELEKNYIYVGNLVSIDNTPQRVNFSWPEDKYLLYMDQWIVGNQEQILYISEIYNWVIMHMWRIFCPHIFLFGHIHYSKFKHMVKFKYYFYFDYTGYRWFVNGYGEISK